MLSVSQYTGVTKRRLRVGSEDPDTRSSSLVGYKVVFAENLVVNIMLAWNGSLGVSPLDGVVSPAYCVYKFKEGYPHYFHYLFRSPILKTEFKRRSSGVVDSRLRLYTEDLFQIPIPAPPHAEQKQIARYLDWKTAQIGKFIRNKRQLIALLKEQKQNLIHHAVTRGLNPGAPTKPSGIEWLGDVPEHWVVRRLKTVSKILRGKFTHRPRNDQSLYNGSYPFIQTGEVARANKYITSYRQTLNDKGYAVSKKFPKGTLTMTIAANIGDVAILDFDACFPDSIVGFVPDKCN